MRSQAFFSLCIVTVVASVFNNTLTHRPLLVSEKLLPKIAELLLFEFGIRHTCLLLLSSFNFLILNVATKAWFSFNLNF